MNIGKRDLFWNYGATVVRILSGLVTMSLIIKLLPIEDIALWGLFFSLESLIYLLDFGFYSTISRNITYIFSGASKLNREGLEEVREGSALSFPLLKGLLRTTRIVYASVSFLMLAIFLIAGTFYINSVLTGYSGDVTMAKIAWYTYGLLLCYRFFTFYYDALLIGRGMIKRSKQIFVLSQVTHLVIASSLLVSGFGLISLVIGQICSTIVNRILANRAFYDRELVTGLKKSSADPWREILATLWPTVYKSGFSSISSVLLKNILPLIAGLYLPLAQLGRYSISKTFVDLTFTMALAWFMTYYPKLTSERSKGNNGEVKRLYVKAQIVAFVIFAGAAVLTIFAGNDILALLKKDQRLLIAAPLLLLYFAGSLLESNTYMSMQVILSRNSVPYYKSQLTTALISITLTLLLLELVKGDILFIIAVPIFAQMLYQHWKWPLVVIRELKIRFSDYTKGAANLFNSLLP